MKTIAYLILLFAACAAPLVGSMPPPPEAPQNTDYYVDAEFGNDANNGETLATAFRTITKGIDAATNQTGPETVRVYGRTCDANGNTLFYSDSNADPSRVETFPLSVPSGTRILGVKGDGVNFPRIGISGSSPAFLIKDVPGGNAGASIERFGIYGGDLAIRIEGTDGDNVNTLVKKVTFSRNKTAIEVFARNESLVEPTIQTCTIIDGTPTVIYPAVCDLGSFTSNRMDYGIRFEAEQSQDSEEPGAIEAQIINLSCSGFFDKGASLSHYRRLIDIEANGNTRRQHEDSQFFDEIARVDLEISASANLDGGAGSGLAETGWNYGLYASSGFADGASPGRLDDYASRFRVTFTDCTFTDFRRVAIYGEGGGNNSNGYDTRAQFEFDSEGGTTGVTVLRTGSHLGSSTPTDETGTGILLKTGDENGYASLVMEDSRVADNWNDGVYIRGAGSDPANESSWPSGAYFFAQNSIIESNRGHGISLEAINGSVGSTWHGSGDGNLFRRVTTEPVELQDYPGETGILRYGQGGVDACSINNNGAGGTGDGVRVATTGQSHAGVAITNTIIWNNEGVGIRYLTSGAIAFCPVVNCTVAGNNGGMNMEAIGDNWRWKSDEFNTGADELLRTGIYDSIFEMKNPAAFDFGVGLMGDLERDDSPNTDFAHDMNNEKIFSEALRAKVDIVNFSNLSDWFTLSDDNTDDTTPFATNPIIWTSADATQLFLSTSAQVPFKDGSFTGLGATGVESTIDSDYSGDARTDPLHDHDKGAEEL